MQMVRIHFKIFGRVQGVNYRWFVLETAKSFAITGWVRNSADGSVELEAQGKQNDLEKFENILKNDHPIASVEKLQKQKIPLLHNEQNFNIIY